MIADRPEKNDPSATRMSSSTRLVIDEKLISPKGWMTLDPISYLKSMRSSSASVAGRPKASIQDDVLDLSIADMAAARLTRSLQARRSDISSPGVRGPEGFGRIPASDIVSIGGGSLRRRTPDQPFPDEAELANDNLGRFVVLLVLLLAVAGGYIYTTFRVDDRRAIEVTPPDSAGIKIVSLEQGDS